MTCSSKVVRLTRDGKTFHDAAVPECLSDLVSTIQRGAVATGLYVAAAECGKLTLTDGRILTITPSLHSISSSPSIRSEVANA